MARTSPLIRTQVQFTKKQLVALRRLSAANGAFDCRDRADGVELYLSKHTTVNRDEQIKRAIRVSGKFSSGLTDVSANHDRYLG
jgi:hypothetical protein